MLGMFIKRGTSSEGKNDLRLNTNGSEDIWIEGTLQGRPRAIDGIYRHPRNQCTQFQEILTSTIAALNIKNKPFYVLGDFNINTFKYQLSNNVKCFVDAMHASGCNNIIDEDTRIKKHRHAYRPRVY